MKIVFIGAVHFSYKVLNSLLEGGFDVVGVVTKKKSKFNSDFVDLTNLIEKYKLSAIFKDESSNQEVENFIRSKSPDVIYCFGWSHILPKSTLEIPPYGVVGFHPAELPNNRGRHPIIWALFLGLEQTASTFFFMDEGADTGDIISQQVIPINKEDTALSLYNKIINEGLIQVLAFSNDLEKNKGQIKRISQDINQGNNWRKRGKNDGKIDFRMTTSAICNLIKALTHPYVGAHVEYEGNDYKVWKAVKDTLGKKNDEPGKILKMDNNEIVVKTYDGSIRLIEHEFQQILKQGEYL